MIDLAIIKTNVLSPAVLAFCLGLFSQLIKSEFRLPKDLYSSLSIYLLLAIGLKGGIELSETSWQNIAGPVFATLIIALITPLSTYWILNKMGKFSAIDSAAMAAHYGSVSAVTMMASQQFAHQMGISIEGYMPTLLILLASPGIQIAVALGAPHRQRVTSQTPHSLFHEILTAPWMLLLSGGLCMGFLMGKPQYQAIQPFFEIGFQGALVLFLLELGIRAGDSLIDLKKAGLKISFFAMILPLIHGVLGVFLGHWFGLSTGGASVLGAMAASASYIAAPAAVQAILPEANPTFYLTAALAITFPFNLIVGIPIFLKLSSWLH